MKTRTTVLTLPATIDLEGALLIGHMNSRRWRGKQPRTMLCFSAFQWIGKAGYVRFRHVGPVPLIRDGVTYWPYPEADFNLFPFRSLTHKEALARRRAAYHANKPIGIIHRKLARESGKPLKRQDEST